MDVDAILSELLPQIPENVFSRWLFDRVSLTWLEEDDDRLGMTRFEDGNVELSSTSQAWFRPRTNHNRPSS